ncbi:LuxR family transcriptional regulator [Pelomonas sp. Root1237]|uniref:helix-turn-helix transcriptional regulator n=1 Tax=Pelomonas sp. Root1237 TaxID=1736434 RepID=UPI00138F086A|nr:LuxR family transcriptional regulator [Pelomonas sp. Root1237]
MSLGAAFGRGDHPLPPGANGTTPVLLHDEPPGLQRDLTQPRLQPALLVALMAAETPELRQRSVKALLQSLGFEWLGYGCFSQAGDRPVPRSFCTTYADPAWTERYFAETYHLVDPRLQRVPESGLPVMWTLDELQAEAETPSYLQGLRQRFFDDLRATGAGSGVMMGLPSLPGRDRHIISLISKRPGRDWMTDAVLGQVLTLALCLHEFYSRYTLAPQADGLRSAAGALTPLQNEILARLARGLPDKLIAAQLDLSLHNVDYHMRQLRKRFGVRNRLQLMQAALGPAPHAA